MAETEDNAQIIERLRDAVVEHRTWFIVLGAVLLILGLLAIAFPLMSSIAAKIYLGWIFLIGGVAQAIHAFQTKSWGAFLVNLLVGVLYIVAGAWLAFLPFTGLVGLTVLLAALFVLQGAFEAVMAFQVRPRRGWIWMLVAGIVAIAAGVLIFAELPGSAGWAIGLIVGVNLISSGWAFLALALAAEELPEPAETA